MPQITMTPGTALLLTASTADRPSGVTMERAVKELAYSFASLLVSSSGLTALTDNSTGTALTPTASVPVVFPAAQALGAVANAGNTNLAGQTGTEAALSSVRDALVELFARANAVALILGLAQVSYLGGGAAADGTISAINPVVASAATGANVAGYNAVVAALNNGFYSLDALVNMLARAVGRTHPMASFPAGVLGAVAAIPTATGTAGSPGVQVTEVAASVTTFRNNVATLSAVLNAVIAKALPRVLVQ